MVHRVGTGRELSYPRLPTRENPDRGSPGAGREQGSGPPPGPLGSERPGRSSLWPPGAPPEQTTPPPSSESYLGI